MPYLEQHGDGWRVCWREGGRGSKVRKGAIQPTKVLAAAELRAVAARLAATRQPRTAIIAWSEVRARWLRFLAEQGRTPAYCEQARRTLDRCTATWQTTGDATPDAMARLKVGPWRLAKACLRWSETYLRQPLDRAAVARRPHRAVSRPTPDLLTDDQVATLLDRAEAAGGSGGRLLAHLVATYGHRPQSLVGLSIEALEVPLDGVPRLTLPVKSGDRIRHPVLPATVELWRAAAAGRDSLAPILLDPLGKPWPSGARAAAWFWHMVGTTKPPKGEKLQSQPPPIGIYQLKSYAISRMLDLKLDLKTIASITGHRTPAVLLRYARTNEARQIAALSALAGADGATQVLPTKAISH